MRRRMRRIFVLVAAGGLIPMVAPTQSASATGPEFFFSRTDAINYANTWEFQRNTAEFKTYSDNCTNYASQVWWAGGAAIDSNGGNQWYFQPPVDGVYFTTPSWRLVKDFRSYWYADQSHVYYDYDYAVTTSYNSALPGDAIVYSRGDNGTSSPDFSHIGIEHHYKASTETDYEIQNTYDEKVPWNTFYYDSTAIEQEYQRYWGYRIIGPLDTD